MKSEGNVSISNIYSIVHVIPLILGFTLSAIYQVFIYAWAVGDSLIKNTTRGGFPSCSRMYPLIYPFLLLSIMSTNILLVDVVGFFKRIHFPSDRQWSCFRILDIMNNAAIKILMEVFMITFSFLFGKDLEVALLEHRVGVCWVL